MGPIRSIFREFSAFNWICFTALAVFFVGAVLCELIPSLRMIYVNYYLREALWGLIVLAYFLSFTKPFVKMGIDDDKAIYNQIFFGIISILTAFFLALIAVAVYGPRSFPYTLLTSLFAASLVGLGWYFHYRVTTKASRRAHTINLLMETRLSEEFQQHLRDFRGAYCIGEKVPREDIEKYLHSRIEQDTPDPKARAVQAIKYLLNFYEFLAVSINKKDVDEEVLFECLAGIAVTIADTFEHAIDVSREQDALAYEHFERLIEGDGNGVDGWRRRQKIAEAMRT
jgi:hypothetical protein